MNLYVLFFVLNVSFSNAFFSFSLVEDEIEDKFSDFYVAKIQDQVARLRTSEKYYLLLHKIGIIALYMRIYKRLVPTPSGKGFLHQYPEPMNDLNRELAKVCLDGIEECVNHIIEYLKLSQPWLIPINGSFPLISLSIGRMEKFINDNLFDLEISSAQILCFLTMREVSAFEMLPFCRYDFKENAMKQLVWQGARVAEKQNYIDEFLGSSYECAAHSFCPDPCCSDVDKKSLLFTERECRRNVCKRPERCSVKRIFNNEFVAIRSNMFNISCPCPEGYDFRSDVAQCVHSNPCGRLNLCPADQDCINIADDPGYACVCQLGSAKSAANNCVSYGVSSQHWRGLAFSETHLSSVYLASSSTTENISTGAKSFVLACYLLRIL